MSVRAAPLQLFFSAEGRFTRASFWATALLLLGLLCAFDYGAPALARGPFRWPVHLVLFVSAVCVAAKRLHDRGHAGWWGAPLLGFFVWAWSAPNPLTGWIAAFGLLWALGSLRGRPGWNRFGPEPRAPGPGAASAG